MNLHHSDKTMVVHVRFASWWHEPELYSML